MDKWGKTAWRTSQPCRYARLIRSGFTTDCASVFVGRRLAMVLLLPATNGFKLKQDRKNILG